MDPSPPDPDLVALAEKLARGAHAGQTRRDGVTPYIVHPADVARRVDTDAEKAVAWLHDVLEDTATTSIDLHEAGIPANVIVAVKALTRKKTRRTPRLFHACSATPLRRALSAQTSQTRRQSPSAKNIVWLWPCSPPKRPQPLLIKRCWTYRFAGLEELKNFQN
jgi:(p)ppGpp synthase/HD superfamily hydrolase